MSTSIWFTPRIWFSEVERIGMQRCIPFGYWLNGVGGLFWFAGIVLIPVIPVYLAYEAMVGDFSWWLLWLLTTPFLVIFVGSILIAVSWVLASRKMFNYEYERDESTWIEGGEKRSYTLKDWQVAEGRSG